MTSSRPASTLAALATVLVTGGIVAALGAVVGDAVAPWQAVGIELGGAAVGALGGAAALRFPAARRRRWAVGTSLALGAIAAVATFVLSAHDRFGVYVLFSAVDGVIGLLGSGLVLVAALTLRDGLAAGVVLREDPDATTWMLVRGGLFVAAVWSGVFALAALRHGPTALAALVAGVGLGATAHATRRRGRHLFAVTAVAAALGLEAFGVVQSRRCLVVHEWREAKEHCTASPHETAARAVVPSIRLAELRLYDADGPGREARLFAVTEDDRPLSSAELDGLGRALFDRCRWDDDYDRRPRVVAKNPEVLPVDVHLVYAEAGWSHSSPEERAAFAHQVEEGVRASFRPGANDARKLGASCWYPSALGVGFGGLQVYVPPSYDFGGARECFAPRGEPAYPRLGGVTVEVRPHVEAL